MFIDFIRTHSNTPFFFYGPFFMAEYYSIVCMYHGFFIRSSAEGHLGCFCVPAIVKYCCMNIGVDVSFSVMDFSGYMSSNGFVGSYCTIK